MSDEATGAQARATSAKRISALGLVTVLSEQMQFTIADLRLSFDSPGLSILKMGSQQDLNIAYARLVPSTHALGWIQRKQ